MSETFPNAYQQRCGTCWFARRMYKEGGDLLCCKRPPQPSSPDLRCAWPKVNERMWCGEYKARPGSGGRDLFE